jgi:mannose-6-phosphate isomerase-like protein (cupin superfamily)
MPKLTPQDKERNLSRIETVFTMDHVVVKHLVLAPGQEVPWHFHNRVRDTFYVVCGPVTIFTREPQTEVVVLTGETFQTRERQPHRVFNASDHEVSALLIQGVGEYDFHPVPVPS